MKKTKSIYHGHRFPAAVISQAVRSFFRFQLSLRDIEVDDARSAPGRPH
jgi:putative transposase